MNYFRGLLAVSVIILFSLNSCSKGNTGPAGPAGPDSVIHSAWIPLTFVYNKKDSLWEDTLTAPSITGGIIDSGVILSYIQFTDANKVVHIQSISSLSNVITEDYSVGKIYLSSFFDLTTYLYRYVVIPGSKKANSTSNKIRGYTPTDLKAMSFEQVQQVLGQKN